LLQRDTVAARRSNSTKEERDEADRNARGAMEVRYRNPAGTEFDFVFRLIG
jgi:hypothetical protein